MPATALRPFIGGSVMEPPIRRRKTANAGNGIKTIVSVPLKPAVVGVGKQLMPATALRPNTSLLEGAELLM